MKKEIEMEEKGKVWPQYMTVLIALIPMFNTGLNFGWPSPSIPIILSDDYPLNITAEEASYIITLVGPSGDIVGSILYPAIVNHIGRKITIILIAVPQILSMVMIYFSTISVIPLYIGRFMGGLAEAACFTILPLYIGEVAEPKVRGVLGSYFSFILMIGVVIMNLTGSYFSIQTCALVYSTIPVIFILCFLKMPESPYYLLMKSHTTKAENSLKFLRGKQNVKQELTQLTNDVKRQMSEPGSYKDLYQNKTNKIACIIMFGLRIIQQFSGITAFTLYMQTLFEKSTDVIPKHLASSLIFSLQLMANFSVTLIVDRVGRKPLLMLSCTGCCFALTVQGIYYLLVDYTSVDVSSLTILPLIVLIIFIISFAIGQGSIVNVMVGEMFSASVKAKASSVMNILFGVTMLLSSKFFQYTGETYSLSVPFLIFAVCQFLGVLFCFWLVPETTGKTLEQIQQELRVKWTVED